MRSTLYGSLCGALVLVMACDGTHPTAPMTAGGASGAVRGDVMGDDGARSVAFAPSAHPFGHSMIHWSQNWWRWAYSVPASVNPLVDGGLPQDCVNGQHGRVWYLPVLVAPATSGSRNCTIPNGKALVVNVSGVLNDFPCPDPTFHPAPGQSLYAFLIAGAAPIVNAAFNLQLSVDGQAVPDVVAYRFTSKHLFSITGDPSLQSVLDPCITGTPQPAISDGYTVMLKPLSPGQHVVTWSAQDPMGTTTDTFNLTVRRDDDQDDGIDDSH